MGWKGHVAHVRLRKCTHTHTQRP